MAKFPGGTPGRWDRIAVEIGRTVAEVSIHEIPSLCSIKVNFYHFFDFSQFTP